MLNFLTTLHYVIVIGNTFATVVLPFITPWYIWLPICTLMCNYAFGMCPLTWLENKYKRKQGLREYPSFGDYLLRRWL